MTWDGEVLQQRRTLDEVLLSVMEPFPNGCSYTLQFEDDGAVLLRFGCYGVHVNLQTGDGRLLLRWFESHGGDGSRGVRIDNRVRPETLDELKRRIPCRMCGGFMHRAVIAA